MRVKLLCVAVGVPLLAQCGPSGEPPMAIVGATVIDGTGSPPLVGATILIRDGLVEAVGSADAIDVERRAHVIDAAGKYVIPGLADMHVHFSSGGLVASEVSRLLRQFLYYGVTTVLNVGGSGGSIAAIQDYRAAIAAGTMRGPTIYATGGLITVPGSHPVSTIMSSAAPDDWSQLGVWVVDDETGMQAAVRSGSAAGMDATKIVVESGPTVFGDIHPQMPANLVAAAVAESRRLGLPVLAHATSSDELKVVVDAGVDAVMHLVQDADPILLAEAARRGIYYVPTLGLSVWADSWGNPQDNLTDPFLLSGVEAGVIAALKASGMLPEAEPAAEDLAWRREFLGGLSRAVEAGVIVVAGTDSGNPVVFPGFSMHHELALMVEAGMSPMDALVSGTGQAAQMLGRADEFGTLQPGRRADLLILGADPLVDIRNTRSLELVIQQGVVLDRASLVLDVVR